MEDKIDYNEFETFRDVDHNIINVVIEIPIGSTDKIEWNNQTQKIEIDRTEPCAFIEPANYGFIPKALGGDNDNLDALVLSEQPIRTGLVVKAKVVGIMKFIDNNEVDDKIITVLVDEEDKEEGFEISAVKKAEIEYYFSHYKDYISPGLTKVVGWGGIGQAKNIIEQARQAYQESI